MAMCPRCGCPTCNPSTTKLCLILNACNTAGVNFSVFDPTGALVDFFTPTGTGTHCTACTTPGVYTVTNDGCYPTLTPTITCGSTTNVTPLATAVLTFCLGSGCENLAFAEDVQVSPSGGPDCHTTGQSGCGTIHIAQDGSYTVSVANLHPACTPNSLPFTISGCSSPTVNFP